MARIENNKYVFINIFNQKLDKKISIFSTFELDPEICVLFSLAFSLLSIQLDNEKLIEIPKCNCIITDSDKITLVVEENEIGLSMNLCIFPIYKWVNNKYNKTQILTIILEELCHSILGIEDELIVKKKVLEIMRMSNEKVELNNFYSETFLKQVINEYNTVQR